jgi:SSS family solute:Na+ symporter
VPAPVFSFSCSRLSIQHSALNLLLALHTLDYAVVVGYLVAMLWLGAYFSRTQNTSDEYFLASRRIPWFAIGLSIIATLMSSLTYVSEPGEVWKSGIGNMLGKMLAIPFEMAIVWAVFIPFLTKLRYTSAYEYLGDRFGATTKWVGITLFLWLAVAWMGFIVLVSSRILATASGLNLVLVVAVVGIVATVYTVAGGFRAVIWTDVAQVVLMLGGALMTIGYVAVETSSGPADWYRHVDEKFPTDKFAWFSADPFARSTILTVAASMFIWHVCTHVSNQMTVQRYFSAGSLASARRSFVVGSLTGVGINLLLLVVGLALFYYYRGVAKPEGLSPTGKETDSIFPLFALRRLPAGLAGAWLAAMLAGAMSSIDSGINSAASVLSVEYNRRHRDKSPDDAKRLAGVKLTTLALGLFITAAAYGLDLLTRDRNIIDMMGRSFNCFTGQLGGLFLLGMFVPRCGNAGATVAGLVGTVVAISIAYSKELFDMEQSISFTWVLPCSLAATLLVGALSTLLHRGEGGGAADG